MPLDESFIAEELLVEGHVVSHLDAQTDAKTNAGCHERAIESSSVRE